MTKAVTSASGGATPAASAPFAAEFASIGTALKDWRSSLTLQGIALATVAAPWATAHGSAVLAAVGVNPADATSIATETAKVLTDLGGVMGLIGRVRLGGLK